MRKNIPLLLLVMTLAFAACAQPRKAHRSRKTVKSTKTTTVSDRAAGGQHRITSVSMNRTSCFGRCPNYIIVIHDNGTAEYMGKQFTKFKGVYQKNIGKAKAQEILNGFMTNRADTCSDNYTQIISDVPGIYYVLMVDGKKKVIGNANFGPRFLTGLAQQIDEAAVVDATWKQTNDTVPEEN